MESDYYTNEFECDTQPGGRTGGCCDTQQMHAGFPVGKEVVGLPNLKETVDRARENLTAVDSEFFARKLDVALDQWRESPEYAVQVLSGPVFPLSDAIASMKEAMRISEEIEEAEKKIIILTILSGMLFLIPSIGAAVGSVGRTGIAIEPCCPSSKPAARQA